MISCLAPSFLPSTCVLELTYQCNHTCLFCSCPWEAPDSKFIKYAELTLQDWKNITSSLARKGITSFAFSGGEPLLFNGIFELIQHISYLNYGEL